MGIELGRLLTGAEVEKVNASADLRITQIAYDSRMVEKGALFVALAGVNTDGVKYIRQALERGAEVILSAAVQDISAAQLVCADPRRAMRILAENFYGQPEKKVKLIGVTGTNGKTTVAQIIAFALQRLGHKAGVLGTVGYNLVTETVEAPLTTPESPEFQRYLSAIHVNGGEYAVCEYSSQALAQERVVGDNVDIAVFTNLSRDHLDNHGNMENYFLAKKMLFDRLDSSAVAVINTADAVAEGIVADTAAQVIRVGSNSNDDFRLDRVSYHARGTEIEFGFDNNNYIIDSALVGDFNVTNLLESVAVLSKAGFSIEDVIAAVSDFSGVGGRLERIESAVGHVAYVDYAHTDDALAKVLAVLKKIVAGRLIVVFGCGGDRDRGKRALMGRVAEKSADLVIVTNDNPRTEDPEVIINDIMQGFEQEENIIIDFDRTRAIETALKIASKDDIVLVAGKGHEDYQIIGRKKIHFDDREVIREFFSRIGEK